MSSPLAPARPQLRSKFDECYSALLAGQQPWITDSASAEASNQERPAYSRAKSAGKSNSGPRSRYFADLLCLPVETRRVVELLEAINTDVLLDDGPNSKGGIIRENVGSLWREAIRVWQEEDEDQVRRKNAVDTLVALSYPILTKKLSNYAFDIITIFAGAMDDADDVFTALVDAIDDTLRGHRRIMPRLASSSAGIDDEQQQQQQSDHDAQHRSLQLGLLWLSCVSQTSLGAYFVRRDLFVTISSFILHPSTSAFAFESALFIGLLATVGQAGSGSLALGMSSSNPYARRLRDWVDEQCMSRILLASSAALQQAIQQYVSVADDTRPTLVGSIAGLASFKWITGGDKQVDRRRGSIGADFSHLPYPAIVILLPLFLLARSNQAFTSLMFDVGGSYGNLLSVGSYLCTHSSTTPRARSYARITLLLLLVLVFDPKGARRVLDDTPEATAAASRVRICRQREPALGLARTKRLRLVTCHLDVATCYLRYNLSKKLDVDSHLVALKTVQRCIVLCADERVALEYDWEDTWGSVLGLASFVAARHGQVGTSGTSGTSGDIASVVKAVIWTLNCALVRSDRFLGSTSETHHLIYELVRASGTLRRAVLLLDASTEAGARAGTGAEGAPMTTPPKLYAQVAGWRNIERVVGAVEAQLDQHKHKQRYTDVKGVLGVVAALDLETLLAGGEAEGQEGQEEQEQERQQREWLERMQEKSLAEFVRHSCADVLRILPIY